MTATTIKVSKHNRDRLAHVARRYGRTMDQALGALLAEHEMSVEARAKQALADEAFMARVREAQAEPMDEAVPHHAVLATVSKGTDA